MTTTVYTDGACSPNPGRGGWAAILVEGSASRVLTGSCAETTNNRMEMTAVLEGLLAAAPPDHGEVVVVSDSKYVVWGASRWTPSWRRRNWITRGGTPVLNRDLWERIDDACAALRRRGVVVRWSWVPGHAGHSYNERCDQLAVEASRSQAGRTEVAS